MRRRHGESSELVVGEFLAGAAQVLRLRQDALGDRHDRLARLRHRHQALAMAHEHLDAELLLERADLLRDPGLRGMKGLRRLGHVEPSAYDFG